MIEFIGLIVAVIALIFGIWHILELRYQVKELTKQTEQARAHTEALDVLRRELPTRYLAQFPDYLPEIVNLFDKANKEIVVFCDFPAYGSFSNPRKFFDYREKLARKLNEGLTVQVTCLTSACRMKITRDQFLKGPWTEWQKNPQNAERLNRLLKRHGKKEVPSEDEFIQLLEEDDVEMLKAIKADGATVFEVDKTMPLYYWIADNREAIFAIIVLSDQAVEYGFRTSDQQLINALNEMREYYLR